MYDLKIIPHAEYHAGSFCDVPLLSKSIAHQMLSESPIHAYRSHPKLGGIGRKSTRDMDRGTVVHDLLLSGGKLEGVEIVYADNFKTNAAKAARDEIIDAGGIPIIERELNSLIEAASAINNNLFNDHGIELGSGQTEGVALWAERADDGTEVHCKARLDHWFAPQIDDLKTCASAHPLAVYQSIVAHGYDLQAAAYVSAIEHLFPDLAGRVRFRFLFVELEEPYLITPATFRGSMAALGRSKWRRAVNRWAECLRTGIWPGYVDGTYEVEAKAWHLKEELEQSTSTVELASFLD